MSLPPELVALYDTAAKGFTTCESSPEGCYELVTKFKTLADLQSHYTAWVNAMVHVRDLQQVRALIESKLSSAELRVVKLVAQGHPNKVIARKFDVSEGTVKNQLASACAKLGVRTRVQLAMMYCGVKESEEAVA